MSKKIRAQFPPFFRDYKKYKPFLQKEFDNRCVYCLINEAELSGSEAFHIDHYRPLSKFPDEACSYTNLYYSCRRCNRFKGDFWPSLFDRLLSKFIINPCDHDPEEHFDRSEIYWKERSETGKWNIDRLRLNSEANITIRQDRETLNEMIKTLRAQKSLAETEMLHANDLDKKIELDKIINACQRKMDALNRKINLPLE